MEVLHSVHWAVFPFGVPPMLLSDKLLQPPVATD